MIDRALIFFLLRESERVAAISALIASSSESSFVASIISVISFDAKEYQARQKLINSYRSGPDSNEIKSYNTNMGHVERFLASMKELGNTVSPTLNHMYNAVRGEFSDSYQRALGKTHTDLETAMAEYNRGTTGKPITVSEATRWHKLINDDSSPGTMESIGQEFLHNLKTRMDATAEKWNKGFKLQPGDVNYKTGLDYLDPANKKKYEQITGEGIAGQEDQTPAGQKPPSKQGSQNRQSATTPQSASSSSVAQAAPMIKVNNPDEVKALVAAGKLKSGDQFVDENGKAWTVTKMAKPGR